MVEMAKAHGLNIYEYLKFLLEHRPSKDMTDEQLVELHESIPTNFKHSALESHIIISFLLISA